MMALIWLWVVKNWKLVAIGAIVLGFVAYIGTLHAKVAYYKDKYETTQLALNDVVKEAEDYEEKLNASFTALEKKYKDTLATAQTLLEENADLLSERIRRDQASKRIRVPVSSVELFNASTQQPKDTAPTVKSDVGKTSTPDATSPSNETATDRLSEVTLNDILVAVNINHSNHLKCVEQVKEWQNFWKDVENTIEVLSDSAGHDG